LKNAFKKIILIYPNLTSLQIQFKSISNLSFLNLKSCLQLKKEFMLQPPWLSAHFVAQTIFVSPSLPPKPARSARPFGPASIGSHLRLPSAPPPLWSHCRAVRRQLSPSSAHEEPNQNAIMPPSLPPQNRRRPISSSPFNSFETDEE
jgi:hypothetical protein